MAAPSRMPLVRLIKGFARNYLGIPTPLVLCHQVTLRCNLRCPFCPYWRRAGGGEELSAREVEKVVSQAAGLGAVIYTVWGGEPLLREDLHLCLRHAKRAGMVTYVITNGILWRRIEALAPHLDYMTVSIDGTGEVYRRLRGARLEEALRALEVARGLGVRVAINCVVCEENLGELERLVELAQHYGAGITFEPVHRFEEVPPEVWDRLDIRSRERYEEAVERLIALKKRGRRVLNSLTYLRMMKRLTPRFRCSVHRLMLHVDAYGNVETCFGRLGNVRERRLEEIWSSEAAVLSRRRMRECRGCLFSGYAEASLLYSLRPEVVLNTLRIL